MEDTEHFSLHSDGLRRGVCGSHSWEVFTEITRVCLGGCISCVPARGPSPDAVTSDLPSGRLQARLQGLGGCQPQGRMPPG